MFNLKNECDIQSWTSVLKKSQTMNRNTKYGQISEYCYDLENNLYKYIFFPYVTISETEYNEQFSHNMKLCFLEKTLQKSLFVDKVLFSRIKRLINMSVKVEKSFCEQMCKSNQDCQKCKVHVNNVDKDQIDLFSKHTSEKIFNFSKFNSQLGTNKKILGFKHINNIPLNNIINFEFIETIENVIQSTNTYLLDISNTTSFNHNSVSKGFFTYYLQAFKTLYTDYKTSLKTDSIYKLGCLIPIYYYMFNEINSILELDEVFTGFYYIDKMEHQDNLNTVPSLDKLYDFFFYKVKYDIDMFIQTNDKTRVFYYIKDNTFSPPNNPKPKIINSKTLYIENKKSKDVLTLSSGESEDISFMLHTQYGNIFSNVIPILS